MCPVSPNSCERFSWVSGYACSETRAVGIDLYDLQALRTRSLVFIHDLVEALRASGVSPIIEVLHSVLTEALFFFLARQIAASYRLQPSNCPLCVVCALPPNIDANKVKAAATAAVENAHLELKCVLRPRVICVHATDPRGMAESGLCSRTWRTDLRWSLPNGPGCVFVVDLALLCCCSCLGSDFLLRLAMDL